MIVNHVLPAGWVDTDEVGKIQPSAVVDMVHTVELEPADIELLRGVPGQTGEKGDKGDAGLLLFEPFGLGVLACLVTSVVCAIGGVVVSDGSNIYSVISSDGTGAVYMPIGSRWRFMSGSKVGIVRVNIWQRVG